MRLTNEQASIGDSLNADPYEKFRGIMTSCLHEAREDRELQPGIEPAVVAEFVIAACTGMQMYSNVVNGRRDLPERTQQMWNLLLPGIAVPSVITRAEATLARPECPRALPRAEHRRRPAQRHLQPGHPPLHRQEAK